MAKKIKPNLAAFTSENIQVEKPKSNVLSDIQNENISMTIDNSLIGERITTEQKEKLDLYDGIKNENSKLLKEKENLENKIIEYISELNSLCVDISSVNELKKINEDLSIELNNIKNKYSDIDINKLKKDNAELQESNDNNLMKIAELSFENAKMTSEIQELTMKLNSTEKGTNNREFSPEFNKPIVSNEKLAKPYVNPYNPYIRNNGYGTWN